MADVELLQAEIEALRAEVEMLRGKVDEAVVELLCRKARAERLAEVLRELRDLMLGQVKWAPCDCGCPQQRTPDGPHSVTWLRAAQQVEIAISKAEGKE